MADDADDWKYAVEDFEDADDSEHGESTATATDSDDGQATDVFGENTSRDIEPGSPTFENTLFVLLGVALALLVIVGV